jgi:hypothetical protein
MQKVLYQKCRCFFFLFQYGIEKIMCKKGRQHSGPGRGESGRLPSPSLLEAEESPERLQSVSSRCTRLSKKAIIRLSSAVDWGAARPPLWYSSSELSTKPTNIIPYMLQFILACE